MFYVLNLNVLIKMVIVGRLFAWIWKGKSSLNAKQINTPSILVSHLRKLSIFFSCKCQSILFHKMFPTNCKLCCNRKQSWLVNYILLIPTVLKIEKWPETDLLTKKWYRLRSSENLNFLFDVYCQSWASKDNRERVLTTSASSLLKTTDHIVLCIIFNINV